MAAIVSVSPPTRTALVTTRSKSGAHWRKQKSARGTASSASVPFPRTLPASAEAAEASLNLRTESNLDASVLFAIRRERTSCLHCLFRGKRTFLWRRVEVRRSLPAADGPQYACPVPWHRARAASRSPGALRGASRTGALGRVHARAEERLRTFRVWRASRETVRSEAVVRRIRRLLRRSREALRSGTGGWGIPPGVPRTTDPVALGRGV